MQKTQTTLLAEANFEHAIIRLYKDPEAFHPEAYWVEIDEGSLPTITARSGLYDALALFSETIRFEELERD